MMISTAERNCFCMSSALALYVNAVRAALVSVTYESSLFLSHATLNAGAVNAVCAYVVFVDFSAL